MKPRSASEFKRLGIRTRPSWQSTMQLVQSLAEVQINALRFQHVAKKPDSIAFKQLGRYFHWFYFPEHKVFAPSKFIGYKGMAVSNYSSQGTGTETTRTLSKFFTKLERPSQAFDNLLEDLSEWLHSLSADVSPKTVRGTGGIYLPCLDTTSVRKAMVASTARNSFIEGARLNVTQSRSERNPAARARCLEIHGKTCHGCDFNFELKYGSLGAGFIHVHHLNPLRTIHSSYIVDAKRDLIPLCPNCHAMIHRLSGDQSLTALRKHIADAQRLAG
jgi:hypothetical protein